MKVASKGLAISIAAMVFQCSPSSTTTNEQDSLASSADSVGEQHFISTPNAAFSFEVKVDDKGDDEILFEAFQKGFTEYQTSYDSVVFESHEYFRGDILSAGKCAERTILEVRVTVPSSGSLFVHWYVIEEVNPGWFAVFDPIIEDVTEYQDVTSADMSLEHSVNECPVLTVTYKTEGGDIDIHSREIITFYSVEAGFKEILKIELDNTEDQDGYVEGDSTEAVYERRNFSILESKTNNLSDIQVDFDNGSEQKTEVYAWNGTVYSLKLNYD